MPSDERARAAHPTAVTTMDHVLEADVAARRAAAFRDSSLGIALLLLGTAGAALMLAAAIHFWV